MRKPQVGSWIAAVLAALMLLVALGRGSVAEETPGGANGSSAGISAQNSATRKVAATRSSGESAIEEQEAASDDEASSEAVKEPREAAVDGRTNRRRTLPQVARIDELVRANWKANQIAPSQAASDAEYCRRVYLDLIGRIPSVAELQEFLGDKRPDRKSRLVHRLLHDEAYAEDYATHWSTVWANLLVGRPADNQNGRVDRGGMERYLRDSFAQNLPYDRLVHDLVAAEGTTKPGAPGFNGAANFLAAKLDDRATQATAQTARLFLGMQVQCTQCHNHPFNEAKQNQFWQLNAFFRQTVALRRFDPGTNDVSYVELTDQDFAGEDQPADAENARIYYELRNGKLETAFPVFLDGAAIKPSGFVEDVKRRRELADLMVRSPYLSTAIVNRMWAHFLGYGFTRPIDDMGPHNRPVLPEVLDYLAAQLRENSHDLKQLMAWIVLSEPYGLSSVSTAGNRKDDPTLGEPPAFTHFYVRQMTAEQLYRSLLVASEADKTQASTEEREEAQREWLKQFTIAFGTDEGDETTTFDGTITQTLMMFNGELIERATSGDPGSFLHRVSNDSRKKPVAKVQQLYLAALARRPTQLEMKMYQQLLVYHQQNELAALQDLWWALLNSNQFILNF
jgi:hypothetical protein